MINEQHLALLMSLTDIRGIKELRSFLIYEIQKIPLVSEVALYQRRKCRPLDDLASMDAKDFFYFLIHADGSIEETPTYEFCARYEFGSSPVLSYSDKELSTYPLQIDSETTEYLIFQLRKYDKEIMLFFEALLHLYKNCMALLLAAETDKLTGLRNRQSFHRVFDHNFISRLSISTTNSKQSDSSCFAMLDIDYFKSVNDEYGHLEGDEVLILFAQLMKTEFRDSDYLFRYGGEEFAVILASTEPSEALEALERFRIVIETYRYPKVGAKTVSIGFTTANVGTEISIIVDQADRALYYSKENGRNQTNYYHDLIKLKKIEPNG